MLRQRIILFLIATVVLLGGALLIYGQRTGKLTIFGATPSSPAQLTVSSTTDLQKGVQAGDGNTELVNGSVQLKQGSQLSAWTRESATTPDFLGAIPAGTYVDYRSYPPSTSFNEQTHKFFVTSGGRLHSYDPIGKSWQTISNNIGVWGSWSNKLNRYIAIQDTGNYNPPTSLGPPSNIISFDATGNDLQTRTNNVQFHQEYEEALYHDPVSDTLVGFRQLDSNITGDQFVPGGARQDLCPRSLILSNCVPVFPQAVEWYDIGANQDNQYSPPQGSGVAWPEARVGATVAYDPIKSEILVFGGFTVTPNFSGGTSSSSFDPTKSSTSFGTGQSAFTNYTFTPASALWAFNTNSRSWSQRIGSNQPPGRAFSKMTYDQQNKRFIVFGGLTALSSASSASTQSSYTTSNDLWSYDPATNAWQLLNIANPPDARFGHGIGYNSLDKQLVVFSGEQGGTVTQQFGPTTPNKLNDTWTAKVGGFASTGTCQFDVGSPQIQQMFRYQSIKTRDIPANTSITVRFAGSVDGVSFDSFSQPFTYAASQAAPDSIDLSQLLPANTHFVRILCSMTSDGTASPTFEGFTIDYQALGTASPTFAISPQLGQAPLTVTATRTDNLPAVCTINFGDGTADVSSTASQTLSHTYQTVGTFTATMTCDGQTSTQVVTVTADASASATLTTSKSTYQTGEVVHFTLTNLGPTAITLDDTVPFVIKDAKAVQTVFDPVGKLTFDSIAPNETRSWFWDQKVADGSQATVGAYIVSVPYTVVGQQQATSKDATFTIQAVQTTPLAFTVSPTDGVAPLTITATYSGTLAGLTWDFGDGTIQSVSQGPSQLQHVYQIAGAYTVSLRSGTSSGSQTVLVSSGTTSGNTSTPILVNGSISGTDTQSSGITTKPATLVSTGANPYVMGLLAAWLLASATILTYQPKRTARHE